MGLWLSSGHVLILVVTRERILQPKNAPKTRGILNIELLMDWAEEKLTVPIDCEGCMMVDSYQCLQLTIKGKRNIEACLSCLLELTKPLGRGGGGEVVRV